MKTILIIALALFATAYAYDVDDIPEFMKERLDKFVELRRKWEQKWLEMTPEEREFYEKMIYSRLSHIPDSVKSRIHTRIEGMEAEDRTKLKNYLYQRFTELKPVEADNEVDELDGVIDQLPDLIREKISDFIAIRFAPAAAYQSEDADFAEFPDIPTLVEVPLPDESEAMPYSEYELPEEVRENLDAFLLKREDWRRRWENLPEEKKDCFQKYLDQKMKA